MQIRQFIYSFFTLVVFFILATATSQEQDPIPVITLNLTAEIVDTNLVLSNNDTLDIENAFMILHQPLGDTTASGVPTFKEFIKENYALNMGSFDTIPLSDFMMGAEVYPNDTMPIFFNLQSFSILFTGNFEVEF